MRSLRALDALYELSVRVVSGLDGRGEHLLRRERRFVLRDQSAVSGRLKLSARGSRARGATRQGLGVEARLGLDCRQHIIAVCLVRPDGLVLLQSDRVLAPPRQSSWPQKWGTSLSNHKDLADQVTFSPDGTKVATASFDGTARVWDVKTGRELFALTNHDASVFDVAFSKDGKYIATASADKTAKIWDAQTGKELLTLNAPGPLSSVAFSPDGKQLAVAGRDGTTRIYLLSIEDLVALAKTRVTRTLTQDECQQYLHVDV